MPNVYISLGVHDFFRDAPTTLWYLELILMYNHMGCKLFWVKFGHAFAYFVVSVY